VIQVNEVARQTVRDLQSLERILGAEDGLAAAFDNWRRSIVNRDGEATPLASFDYTTLELVFHNELAPELQRFKQQVARLMATLASLPACPLDSSMRLVIQGQASLAKCLLSQSQVMLQIGNDLVSEHRRWIEQEITAAIDRSQAPIKYGLSALGPIWNV